MNNPEFALFVGPMFGGKTSKMLASLERARYQKRKIVLVKPKVDDRFFVDRVSTHTGLSWEAVGISDAIELFSVIGDAEIVAVDEAFMIQGVGQVLIDLFKQGRSIYVSSVQLSSSGEPFSEVAVMFPWATRVEVCPAVCPVTGKDAFYTVSLDGGSGVRVGGSELYEPRCYAESGFFEVYKP
jgi:thymidine kinase